MANRAAVSLGRRGGKAGTGAAKRRTAEQYAAIQAKALHARRVKAARRILDEHPECDVGATWGEDVLRDALKD